MKKSVTIISLLLCVSLFLAATDWDDGYLQGYSDALAGLPNRVEQQKESDESGNGVWVLHHYVDDFGDPTDKGYVAQEVMSIGTFSNSATRNSLLRWHFLIDDEDVAIKLFEYGKNPATGYGTMSHRLSVKEADGTVTDFYCNSGSDRIFIENKSVRDFVEILKKEGVVKLFVRDIDYYNSSYNLGEFDCSGFNTVYEKMLEGYAE